MAEKSLYESISYLRDLNYAFKNLGFNPELCQALDTVTTYADDCYVQHAEEVGEIAIENIEELRQETIEDIIQWLKKNAKISLIEDDTIAWGWESDLRNYLENGDIQDNTKV